MLRFRYIIDGLVQGVGFRPYIYSVANGLGLTGFVCNTENGVLVEVQGSKNEIDSFEEKLKEEFLPRLSKIQNITKNSIEPLYSEQFEIIQSKHDAKTKEALVLPDMAICSDCLKQTLSTNSRFCDYFATTCTNCGPRYSILQTVPYDRENTSMAKFKMCSACRSEYENPLDRRYHAQPISCHKCGPKLNKSIKDIAQKINDGKIVAIKGIGGFHLVCDATNDEVVKKLRGFKNRPSKPFAVMFKSIDEIKKYAKVSKKEQELLASTQAPIVILKKANQKLFVHVAPNIDRLGCFLPYTALQHLLFLHLKNPIIATSANLGDEPIISDIKDIKEKLPFIDDVLDFNRDILNAVDDSLTQIVDKKMQILRGGRGYTPLSLKLPFRLDKKVLALGANQKSTIALAFGDSVILSPHIGDLNSLASMEFFEKTLQSFKRFYDFEADVLLCDKHPNYESVKWAKTQNKPIYQIQHHIAHIYAAKAEFGLSGDFVGFSFDGTGYGDDGMLWGGEIFVGDKRRYHFKPIKLLGADKAIKEPRRVALSMLFDRFSLDEVLTLDLPFNKNEIKLLHKSYTKNLNAPLSTSLGRLFDGVASLAGICHNQSYEGEAGLLCESVYDTTCKKSFEFCIDENGEIEIDFDVFDKDIVTKFINTIVEIVLYVSIKEKLDVILSGGVFQNKTLLELILKRLKAKNITCYHQQNTPINDGGISLGQLWFYLNKIV